MPQLSLDVCDVFPLFDLKACMGEFQIVKSDSIDSGLFQVRFKIPVDHVVMVDRADCSVRKHQIVIAWRKSQSPLNALV